MTLLTREVALTQEHFAIEKVDVTEWGTIDPETGKPEPTYVYVRELSAKEKDAFETSLVSGTGKKQKINLENFRARLAVLVCCDENRLPIFRSEDVERLTQKPVKVLSRIAEVAKRLNDLSDEDEEELLKN
ncbi:MAG: hypothetical protein LBC20_18155 [Planctomycetaceae bacterium]|jgi:hypothetical protein|nr:hypothetical protein [Planctomycetaceae bacterium]